MGFLPEKRKEQLNVLEEVKNYQNTLIFYLSPHDLSKNLSVMAEVLGDREAVLVNEITKLYEKTEHFKLGDEVKMEARGEFVLVVEGADKTDNELDQNFIKDKLSILVKNGMSSKGATQAVCEMFNLPKNKVYEAMKILEK